jgi:hypothetical protein
MIFRSGFHKYHGGMLSIGGRGGGRPEDDVAAVEDVVNVFSVVVAVVVVSWVGGLVRQKFSDFGSIKLGSRSLRILSLSFFTLTSVPWSLPDFRIVAT